jgi:hypothetical protein
LASTPQEQEKQTADYSLVATSAHRILEPLAECSFTLLELIDLLL